MEEKKLRVYELAREVGIETKELLQYLRESGFSNYTPMNVLSPQEIDKVKKFIEEKKKEKEQGDVIEVQVREGVIRKRKVVRKPAPSEAEKAQPEEKPAEEKKRKVVKKKKAPKPKPKEEAPKPEKAEEITPAKEKRLEVVKPPEQEEKPPAQVSEQPVSLEQKPLEEEKRPTGMDILKEAGKLIPKKPKPKLRWVKPEIRRTARAADEIPSLELITQQERVERVEEKKEKRKEKKKKSGKPLLTAVEEKPAKGKKAKEPPLKRKLRRKIAFKLERGLLEEGVELVDTERMYMPQKKPSAKKRPAQKPIITTPKPEKRIVKMGENIEAIDLAKRMGIKIDTLLAKLAELGRQAEVDELLDYETAALIAHEFGYEVQQEVFDEAKIIEFPRKREEKNLVPRPPVVTVMGHVDHGKTTLLDYICHTKVAEKEPGAITQKIGAFVAEGPSGKIVFIDTPGHSAFTQMRARGAQVTDIVVLVVAADDGVMPQTVEAINHAKAAGVPIVVAINKIDLPDANPELVKTKLSELGLVPEEWGGDVLMVPCSAKTGEGVDELLEAISLQAELLELKADPTLPARAYVIESKLEKGRGAVASVIVKEGTLKRQDAVVCGIYAGKVRALFDHLGRQIKEAPPSTPVEVIGLEGVPDAGEELIVVEDERTAKMIAKHRAEKKRQESLSSPVQASLEDLLKKMEEGERVEFNLIIKADTHGAVEAVKDSVERLSSDKVEVKVLHSGVGAITENDVLLAEASGAVIIGFGVRPESKANKLAEQKGIQIRTHRIIYELLDELEAMLKGALEPERKEKVIGRAEVRQTFNIPRVGVVAGCYVLEGQITRNSLVRVLRDGAVVFEGRIASLKRFKDDVREVQAGYECGVGIENFNDIKPGDILELYTIEEVKEEQ